jgi:hypothetical protein
MAMNSKTSALDDQQVAEYRENGYLVIRDVMPSDETHELRRIVQEQARNNAYPPSLEYPEPGKYTIGGNKISTPGLAPIAEHPTVIDAVECLLGQPAYLTAYVAYLRSPGDKGGGAHCDYKRWRPVGSSMNWLFAVVPLTDFDLEYGPLLVSPGSNKLTKIIDPNAHILDLTRPHVDKLPPFIDPKLRAGDMLLMNAHTWHKAPAGTTSEDRCGVFNKYCAVNAPPAAGYYPYDLAAYDALSDAGKRLIPVHSDKPISTTRLLIESTSEAQSKFLLVNDGNGGWTLPGGEGWEEEDGVGWDVGARVGSLQSLVKTQLDVDIPWMSYIEDVDAESDRCRVYGYSDAKLEQDSLTNRDWFTKEQLLDMLGDLHDICRVVDTWVRDDIIRGKGKAIHQRTEQFD